MRYTVYTCAGWHGETDDPVVLETEDKDEAAMLAGRRVDIGMPGNCNRYSTYAVDADGQKIDRIESFQCDSCGEITKWGEDGPTGTMDGKILECAGCVGKHLIDWVCDRCAEKID